MAATEMAKEEGETAGEAGAAEDWELEAVGSDWAAGEEQETEGTGMAMAEAATAE